jgi:hypothetical protein
VGTAGPLLLDVLLLAVGEALLVGLGVVRSPRRALLFAGLAFVLGWCALGTLVSLALVLGASLALWQPLVLALVLVAGGIGLALVLPAPAPALQPAAPAPSGLARLFGLGAAGALAVYVGLLGIHAAVAGSPAVWDGWAFWIPKGRAIYYFHGLRPHLEGGFASFAHPEYPPLVPAMHATVFRFAGSADAVALAFQDWLLAAAFLGGLAVLLVRRVPAAVLWPALLILALAPAFGRFIGTGLGDPPLARLIALAAVAGALWLLERDWRLLAIAAFMLVGAALTKAEGSLLGLLLVLALLAAAAWDRPRHVRPLLALLPLPILAAVPWQVWLRVEDVVYAPDYKLGDLLRLGYLTDRAHRLGTALVDLPGYALALNSWLLVVPTSLLLGVLVLRRRRSLGILLLALVGAGYLGLAAVYWVSTLPLSWYLETSADRVTSSIVLVCGALTPLLAAELLREREEV